MDVANESDSVSNNENILVIDGWKLDEARHCIELNNDSTRLEPKVSQFLAYMARHAGETLGREQLLNEVWPGTVVSDEALTNTVNKIRKAFGDDSHNPRIIETIPKMGYRLIAQVEVIKKPERGSVEITTSDTSVNITAVGVSGKKTTNLVPAIGLLIAIVAVAIIVQQIQPKIDPPDTAIVETKIDTAAENKTPSILVLPFQHIGKAMEDDYFIDGMTVDIITDLSKLSNLLVIANQTSLSFKDRDISPQDAGRELGVDYILDGSLRKAKDNLRVNAQLIDVTSGYPLWSERYDRKLDNIFDIQDEITGHIVRELSIRLTTQEKEALKAMAKVDFQAYDIFLRAQRSQNTRTKEGIAEAISYYREAIDLDPSFARAYGSLAVVFVRTYQSGWAEAPQETLNRALDLAHKAISIDDSIPQVYWALGFVHLYRKDYVKAINAVEQTLKIAPNYADGYGLLALINNNQGEFEEAIKNINKGMLLNPYYSFDYPYNLGRANYSAGRYEEAIDYLNQALDRNEAAMISRLFLAACYVKQGLVDDAEWEVDQLAIMSPTASISQLRRSLPLKQELLEELLSDLRVAGMSE